MPTINLLFPQGGSAAGLQGSSGGSLQGSALNLQGSPSQVNTQPQQKKSVTSYGNSSATSPAKQQYINDLSGRFGLNNGTVYNKQTNQGYGTPDQFFKDAGVSSFNNLKLDTGYTPQETGTATSTPGAQPAANPNTPAPDPMKAYKDAMNSYISSLAPSADVSSAKSKYLDYVNNLQLGVSNLEGQGRGIPLQLVRGQQEKLKTQGELTSQRLQQDVALAQDSQTANQGQLKARADFEQSLLSGQKPTELAAGSTLVQFNPSTGKYDTVANGAPKPESLPATAQEYEYAKKQGYKGTFEQYQNEDANRKRSIVNVNSGGLTAGQTTAFNSIVDKYNKSPLIQAADRAQSLSATAKAVQANPGDGATQLNLVYQYIGALDNYNSAVREGELNLVGSLQSKIGAISKTVQNIVDTGKPVDAKTAQKIADAANALVNVINTNAQAKAKSYSSQAQVQGLGDYWNQYVGGFQPSYATNPAPAPSSGLNVSNAPKYNFSF
jgi:hypothetical protein